MRLLILLLFQLPIAVYADSVTQAVTVTGTIGGGPTQLTCVISAPARPTVHVSCTFGTEVSVSDVTPQIGDTVGFSGSYTASSGTITWVIQQATAGVLTYQMSAGNAKGSGSL